MMSRPINSESESFNPAESEYFNTLPPFVQESIMPGAGLRTDEEALKRAAQNILNTR